MVKALVIGAGGALGRALIVRMMTTFETISLRHSDLDITRRNDVVDKVRQVRPDVIFDAAGVSDVDGCEVDKWHAYLTNRDGAKHLAIAAAEIGALLVYPSSDLVFDGAKTTPYREEDSPNPLSIFGDTKLAAELAVMNHSPRHLILRTGWLFGPYGRSYLDDFIEKRETDELIFGFDDHRSQPTFQLDLADAILQLVKQNQTGVWHVANAGEATPFEAGRVLFELKGMDPQDIRPLRRGAGARCALRPRYSVLDCSKLAAAGIRMRPWKDALREYVKSM